MLCPAEQAEHKFEDFSRFLRRQAPAVLMPDGTRQMVSSGAAEEVPGLLC